MVPGGAMAPEEPEFDVVVAGSGAAGMTAALTAARHGLSVVVIEKTAHFGGSTARSGGGVWVPGNSVLRRAGVKDTPDLASTYLAHVAGDGAAPARHPAPLEPGPPMLDPVRSGAPVGLPLGPRSARYPPEA